MSTKIDVRLPYVSMGKILGFKYTNHRGVTEYRQVIPLELQYGVTPEHTEPTWLMHAFCMDRKAPRSFELAKMVDTQEL